MPKYSSRHLVAMRRIVVAPIAILVVLFSMAPMPKVLFVEANPYGEFPHISISSPQPQQDVIYQNTTIPLLIYVYIPKWHPEVASIYYRIDGKNNYTLASSQEIQEYISASGNLVNLTEGSHTLKAYANTLDGKVLSTGCIFTIDTTFQYPQVTIVSPLNKTYSVNEVSLTYTINAKVLSTYCFLDNSHNMTILSRNTTLTNLSEGTHKLSLSILNKDNRYALERYSQQTTYFTVNTTQNDNASLTIGNQTSNIMISVIATAVVVLLAVILYIERRLEQLTRQKNLKKKKYLCQLLLADNWQAMRRKFLASISILVAFSLIASMAQITVNANFIPTVNLSISSPINGATYESTPLLNVSVNFYAWGVNRSKFVMYCSDDLVNTTLEGTFNNIDEISGFSASVLLPNLSVGGHSLKVYAWVDAEKSNFTSYASSKIFFSINKQADEPTIIQPTISPTPNITAKPLDTGYFLGPAFAIAIVNVAILLVVVGLLVYVRNRRANN